MGHQLSTPYMLTGPDGTIAMFNDTTLPPELVGYIDDISGLESPPVRFSADDIPEGHGSDVDPGYYGGRPITLSGLILPSATVAARNAAMDRLGRACDAMDADAILRWTETGRVETALWLRQSAEPKITKNDVTTKRFQLAMFSAQPMIQSWALHTVSDAAGALDIAAGSIVNAGNRGAYPIIRLYGVSGAGPQIKNETTGLLIKFKAAYTVAGGTYVDIDTSPLQRTVIDSLGVNQYGNLDLSLTTWPSISAIAAGNRWTASSGTRLDLWWRDTYRG